MKKLIYAAVFAVIGVVLLISYNNENTKEEFWLGADLGWITEITFVLI